MSTSLLPNGQFISGLSRLSVTSIRRESNAIERTHQVAATDTLTQGMSGGHFSGGMNNENTSNYNKSRPSLRSSEGNFFFFFFFELQLGSTTRDLILIWHLFAHLPR